jgi:hypothetical protein
MDIAHGQELRFARRHPGVPRGGQTPGTMPVPAANGAISITCLMESASFWGARVSSRLHTLDLRPIRRAMHSP